MSGKVKIKLVTHDGKEHFCWTLKGKNLWESIIVNGWALEGTCGGRGTCGKCRVRIEGDVTPVTENERALLLPEEIKEGERLACFCFVNGPLTVYLNRGYTDLAAKTRLYRENISVKEDTPVHNYKFFIPGIYKENPVTLYRRLTESLSSYRLELSIDNLNEIAKLDRVGRPSLELYALIFENKTVRRIGRREEKAYGIALDLGTTSLFAALVDMQEGQVVSLASRGNMQRVYGADIMSRVSYCLENKEGLTKLNRILINNINGMIEEMLQELRASYHNIYCFSVVGNPVMLHFFMGLNINGFASFPYAGIFSDELNYRAADLGLNSNSSAWVTVLPQVGGFVGADTIACLLALPAEALGCYLLLDIGTNGEVVLYNRGEMWAASAAAGPAFEGGGISSGMMAEIGAVDKVYLDSGGRMQFNVLGNKPAKGICGSGIVDLVACLLQAGYIDKNGIFTAKACNRLESRRGKWGTEIILFAAGESAKGRPVVFNQEDVRQVQLAKAAIRTAIDILLGKAELSYADIDRIYLAGAFGNYLDPDNSIKIGMIPPIDSKKIINIGNAAAEGAVAALLSEESRSKASMLKEKIRYTELANHPDFQDMYLNNLNFG